MPGAMQGSARVASPAPRGGAKTEVVAALWSRRRRGSTAPARCGARPPPRATRRAPGRARSATPRRVDGPDPRNAGAPRGAGARCRRAIGPAARRRRLRPPRVRDAAIPGAYAGPGPLQSGNPLTHPGPRPARVTSRSAASQASPVRSGAPVRRSRRGPRRLRGASAVAGRFRSASR